MNLDNDLGNDLLRRTIATAFMQKPQAAKSRDSIPETPCKTKVLGATNIQ